MEPADDAQRPSAEMPCIVYLHGSDTNKNEGLKFVDQILPLGINLCVFDFSGCGNSEGQYITMGHKEKHDIVAVINYLFQHKRVSSIGLWGRSMGASTALLYMGENSTNGITCAVLDSGFSSLQNAVDTMALSYLEPFGIQAHVIKMMQPQVDQMVYDRAGFHIADVVPINAAMKCEVPALFLHGTSDQQLIMDHTEKNFAAYKGTNKVFKKFAGDHLSDRPDHIINEIIEFFKTNLL